VLAKEKVLFVGHPVAAVVRNDQLCPRDGVDLIMVDYEDLRRSSTLKRLPGVEH